MRKDLKDKFVTRKMDNVNVDPTLKGDNAINVNKVLKTFLIVQV